MLKLVVFALNDYKHLTVAFIRIPVAEPKEAEFQIVVACYYDSIVFWHKHKHNNTQSYSMLTVDS